MFGTKIESDIIRHAEAEYPRESCGLVSNSCYLPCENIHETPLSHFKIDSRKYFEIESESGIQAIIHSHPDGLDHPTYTDMVGQVNSDVPWGILPKGKKIFFWGKGTPIPPLLRREFRHGVTDCYSLIKDWFFLEKGVELEEVPRDWKWWDSGKNLYIDGLSRNNFKMLSENIPFEVGDCLLGSIMGRGIVNHAAVYIGDGMILHHLVNRLSCRVPLNVWKKYLTLRVRHMG